MFQHGELTDLAKRSAISQAHGALGFAQTSVLTGQAGDDVLPSTSLAKVLDKNRKHGDFPPDRTRFLGRTADAGRDIAMRPL